MIASVRGTILHKDIESVVVDVQGVGYRLFVSTHTCSQLPEPGEDVSLQAHMVVRDDAIQLYGFVTETEREAFLCLLGVSGIGPKLARSILSGIRPEDLAAAVMEGKGGRLQAIPGVGKRMAERILLELRGKVDSFGPIHRNRAPIDTVADDGGVLENDVLSVLMNLGYRRTEVFRVIREAQGEIRGPLTLHGWVKAALRHLVKP